MKKKILLGVSFLLFMVVIMTGCQKEEIKTFTQTKNGITLEMQYTYKGDMILQQKATNTMPYAIFPVEKMEDIHFLLDRLSQPYQDIKGVEQSIEYQENQAIETVIVDYKNLDLETARQIDSIFTEGVDETKAPSMALAEKWLAEKGFEEVK